MHNLKKFNFTFLILFFFTNEANAYIDPGGISAFIQIIFASVITSIFFLKNYITSFFNNIFNFFKDFKVFYRALNLNEKTFIYCESNDYSIYFHEILKQLKKNKRNFIYLCKSKDENISKLNLEQNACIFNNDFFLLTLLSIIECNNLILTTPDFGNYKHKLSKKIKNTIYIFHSAVSTHMIYNDKAFDNYNTICCVGNHHINELNEKFNISGLKNKLVKCGYPYLDYLISTAKKENYLKKNILFAPSWYPDNPNYYEDNYALLISEILKNNFKIIFRPHPEYYKRFEIEFLKFTENFANFSNFTVDTDKSNYLSMEQSEFLLTDWSGIAFEFAYSFKRPVIFINSPKKILNKDFSKSQFVPVEISDREEIGVVFDHDVDKTNIVGLLNKMSNEKEIYLKKIDHNLNKNIFNIGFSSSIIESNLI